jgi:simple sugar transport system permease protein
VHALLLLVAIVLAVGAAYALIRRQPTTAVISGAFAVLVFVWFKATTSIPIELVTYTPQIITLLVLALATQRLRMPAADGIPWRKGEH